MKYLIFKDDVTGQLFPVLMPDILTRNRVAVSGATPVSAGSLTIPPGVEPSVLSPVGSESTGLEPDQLTDTRLLFATMHGGSPERFYHQGGEASESDPVISFRMLDEVGTNKPVWTATTLEDAALAPGFPDRVAWIQPMPGHPVFDEFFTIKDGRAVRKPSKKVTKKK